MMPIRWLFAFSMVGLAGMVVPVHAADKEEIDKAVTAGVAYLKSIQAANGTWDYEHADGKAGATALAGLALLECGVDAEDPAVQKAAQVVRRLSIELNQTYGLSLSILFLDRLGDPADVPLIVSMSARLLAGQSSAGAWTYGCPKTGPAEIKRLGGIVKLKAEKPAPKKGELTKPDDDKSPRDKRDPEAQLKETQAQIEAIRRELQPDNSFPIAGVGDNSNTQFAILALWVARRQGVPVETALAKVDARFRTTQYADGGWGYTDIIISPNGADPAMTCAGLLGLAAGHGVASLTLLKTKNPEDKDKEPPRETNPKKAPPDPGKDAAIKAGLKALGTFLGDPPAKGKRLTAPAVAGNTRLIGSRLYYFLWSVERVAVAYDLDTIGNRDWYGWGAELVVRTQETNGSWVGDYARGGVDTCFALLFLRRANLARDLTATLKGRVTDPGRVHLKAGGANDPDPKEASTPEPREKPPTETSKDKPSIPKSAEPQTEAERLAAELVLAPETKKERLLESLRESKGAAYTQALLAAIPKLEGEIKKKARDALAERMARMTAATLRERLGDDNAEMRRAAALACAMREEKEHIPRLIELLGDPEAHVSRAAYAALKSLSGKDFGPPKDAGRADIAKAVAAWKGWWKEQGGK